MAIDSSSMNVPLLHEQAHHIDEEKELFGEDSSSTTTNTVTFFRTCLNGINALSGVGILSVPYALASGGWLSLILLFVISMVTFYSGILIKRCMDMNCKIRTFPNIGEAAFGKIGRLLVQATMYTELYIVAAEFLILEGDNLHNLFPNTEIKIAGLEVGGKQLFVILACLVIMPTVWLDDLSLLSYISASGVLASVIFIFSVFFTATLEESIGYHGNWTLLNWNGVPTAASLYAFCYCAHPVFPSLYNSMRNKHQFSYVLLVCFVVSTAGYAFIAIIGYLMYGAEVESQITLNLPKNKIMSQVAIYTTLVNPIAKYALMVTPITNALKGLLPKEQKNRLTSVLISTTLVISTVIVALTVPFFAYLTSLVGAFLSITASIILPCSCYLKISGTYNKFGIETVAIATIILLGLVIGIFGTWISLVQIIEHL
ncbi:PREDICTED: vacuolar amino acid transporter 1-like [Lupinus angustifolius]|uniref:vacuolar amino acid transporter 1-like n=1 Tax=Lupinus angustifolius TaxID=3871 RepID=UPI00092FA27A|nr:PREDICTED: vacuolar amino acid transporter 1-like [Lupinus angustifolius]